ncbi:MAG: magnesium transporter CorA family protein [Christensenellales bacterium]|jgi:magnesium transporter
MINISYTDVLLKTIVNLPEEEVLSDGFSFDSKWVHLLNPTDFEIELVASKTGIPEDMLKAPLDEEERARVENYDDAVLALVDLPILEDEEDYYTYGAVPLGIILKGSTIVTVCLKESSIIRDFMNGRVRDFDTNKKSRFLFQLLFNISTKYLQYLRQIDKASQRIQTELHRSMKNKELIQLLDLENSLVYFSTSLRGNDRVIDKLLNGNIIKLYEEDKDLLEDVAVENRQALEMCNVYRDVLSGTMDAFASVISNNLNIVMKLLTSITILISVPTLIASFLGMNVGGLPGQGSWGFIGMVAFSLLVAAGTAVILIKKKLM